MTNRYSRQNPIPVPTRHDEEIQTDVNLVTSHQGYTQRTESIHSSKFFQFCNNENILRPFSDYYLLNQFNDLLENLKKQTADMDQFKSRQLINELAGQVHGLLARQLRLCGQKSDYYQLLGEKQKQILALQIKNSYKDSNFEKSVKNYEIRIVQLERQIQNLRHTLEKHQTAEEENVIFKDYFHQIHSIIRQSSRVKDLEQLLNKQIIPKVNECEVSLAQLSKRLSKDRTNKVKGAISRYARQLDELANSRTLNWEELNKSAAGFFTSLEHMKDDNWIKHRLNLAQQYEQINNRHIATLSLIQGVVRDIGVTSPSLKALGEFQRVLRQQSQHGFKTISVNGWIGLGTVHCHRHSTHSEDTQKMSDEIVQFRSVIHSFQHQLKKIVGKYPQLRQQLDSRIASFLEAELIGQLIEGQSLGSILEIIKHKTQVVTVDNVYNYYSKTDKDLIFNLKILVKTFLQKFEGIRQEHGVSIDFDQGILALLKDNILDGANLQDILALYRPPARICEIDRFINRPEFIYGQNERGVPLMVQQGVALQNIKHKGVILEKGVPVRQQVNKYVYIQNPIGVAHKRQIPMLQADIVQIPVYETVIREQGIENVKEVNVIIRDQEKVVVIEKQEYVVKQYEVKDRQIPYQVIKKQLVQCDRFRPELIPDKRQYAKVIEVPTTVPVFIQKPIYEVVEKRIPYIVKRQQPVYVAHKEVLIQTVEVALSVDRLVEKRVNVIQHCDCQKPEVINLKTEVAIRSQQPKQVMVEKVHFVKGDEIQKLVEVTIVKQVPLIQQFIKEVEFCVEKLFVQQIWDEKLVIVEKQKPIEFIKYQPVQLHIEKPVIIKDQVIKQIRVEVPVPIIIEKQVCKIVQCKFETIVQKIVEVPRVQIIERIVQKIVPVPRIIQKICLVPQIIEKCVVLYRPILEVVEIQRFIPVIQKKQEIVQVDCVREVLRIQKQPQYIQVKGDPIETKQIIRQPVQVTVVREKIVECIREIQRNVQVQIPVPLVHKMVETIPVQVIRQTPIYVQKQVAIVSEIPIFYKQPQFIIHDVELSVQKIVQCQKTVIQVVEIQKTVILYEDRVLQVPSQPIILRQKQLQLVYVDKAPIVEEIQVYKTQPHYLYADKIVKVSQQTFVQPPKIVQCIRQPQQIKVQRLVPGTHIIQNAIQFPTVRFSDVRTILQTPQIHRLQKTVLRIQKETQPGQIVTVQVDKPYDRIVENTINVKQQIMVVDSEQKAVYLEKERIIEGLKQIIYKTQTCPEYIEKIVEKIIMLPQIVEIQKKVYMIEQINTLIAKDIDAAIYKSEYKTQVEKLKNKTDLVLKRLRNSRSKTDSDLFVDLQAFYQTLCSVDGMPKIVQVPKQVRVQVEKDRPVLVPVYDHDQQIALQTIIGKLVQGVSKFRKQEIEKNFDKQILDIFFFEYSKLRSGDTLEKSLNYLANNKEEYQTSRMTRRQNTSNVTEYVMQSWKSWIRDYDQQLPETQPLKYIAQSYKKYRQGYISKRDDYATLKATFMKHYMQHYNQVEESEKLNLFYIQIIQKLWNQVEDLKKKLATQQFNRDRLSSDYTSIVRTLKTTLQNNQGQNINSSDLESVLVNQPSYISAEQFGTYSSRVVVTTTQRVQTSEYYEKTEKNQRFEEDQKSISDMVHRISKFQRQRFDDQRKIIEFQRENDTLKQDLQQLKQFSSTAQNDAFEIRNQVKSQYQSKLKETQTSLNTQINRLREQINTSRMNETSSNSEVVKQNKKLYDQLNTVKRDHERQIKTLNNQIKVLQSNKNKASEDLAIKASQASSNQQRQLRRQYEQLKRTFQNTESSSQRQKQTISKDYQRKIKLLEQNHERELNKLKSQKQSDQSLEIKKHKDHIYKLQLQLEAINKQLDNIKKSNLGKTAYTSGIKHSAYERQFQSPQTDSRIERYRSPQTQSELSKEQQEDSHLSKQSHGTRSLYRTGRHRVEERTEIKHEQTEEIRSSSSRISGRSESSTIFKSQMTMREFMDIKKVEDKDNIMTFVMIKVIQKVLAESDKGIINSYTPNNIYFSNFNPSNLETLVVKFGAPITNRKSKVDGLYLAPQIHKGGQHTLKSVVFTLGVIWDQMIHYQIYFKNLNEIENITYQFKVRDSKMNPILKNTLFEMMSKDAEKRLELSQAKRRLSLQRYITSEGKPVPSSSRISKN